MRFLILLVEIIGIMVLGSSRAYAQADNIQGVWYPYIEIDHSKAMASDSAAALMESLNNMSDQGMIDRTYAFAKKGDNWHLAMACREWLPSQNNFREWEYKVVISRYVERPNALAFTIQYVLDGATIVESYLIEWRSAGVMAGVMEAQNQQTGRAYKAQVVWLSSPEMRMAFMKERGKQIDQFSKALDIEIQRQKIRGAQLDRSINH